MPKFLRDGVELHYELDGAGEPAVYISGFSRHSNDFIAQGIHAALCPRYRVLATDNRGAGQTVVLEGAPVTIDDMADDIAAILDHHGMTPAHVLGVSMGGCIALVLALRHPQQVRSLALAVTFAELALHSRTRFMLTTSREMRDQGVPRTFVNRHNAIFLFNEAMFEDETFMQAWINAPVDPFEQTRDGFEQQMGALVGYNVRDRLATINAPTLVMSSPDDLLLPPRYQQAIVDGIPGAQIKHYPGGHVFMVLPDQRQRFIEDILIFWRQY